MLWAIVLSPTVFDQTHLVISLFVYLFSVNYLSPDVGGRGYRSGFHPCVHTSVRHKTCVRNSS